jgi:hypothetical protein
MAGGLFEANRPLGSVSEADDAVQESLLASAALAPAASSTWADD